MLEHESVDVLPFGTPPLFCCRLLMRERILPGCHHLRLNQKFFAVEHVREGNLWFRQDGRCYLAEPGDVCLMHIRHDGEFLTGPAGFCLKSSLVIEGPLIESAVESGGLAGVDVLSLRDDSPFEACVDRLAAAMREEERISSGRMAGLCCEAIQTLVNWKSSGTLPPVLTRALDILERELAGTLAVPELARELNVSVSTLGRLFADHLNITPYRCLVRLRMRRAARLLVESDLSVKEIAAASGYGNALNFSTEFRKCFGISPRTYREQYRLAPSCFRSTDPVVQKEEKTIE